MFLKYPIICSHIYGYSNKSQIPPPRAIAPDTSATSLERLSSLSLIENVDME